MRDDEIVTLYWKRDERAIKETKNEYGRYLFKIANNILDDFEDSRESVNDTYLAAWNSMPPHRPSILSTYLGKITRRISIDIFRKKNREKRRASEYALSLSELEECISGGSMPEEGEHKDKIEEEGMKEVPAFLVKIEAWEEKGFFGTIVGIEDTEIYRVGTGVYVDVEAEYGLADTNNHYPEGSIVRVQFAEKEETDKIILYAEQLELIDTE